MKRYIEIVYDNSGSMKNFIGGRAKYEIAQELFEKEILPTVGKAGDEVVLRLLSTNCDYNRSLGESLTKQFGNNRIAMLNRIKAIQHDQMTPLLYTIYDAIQACKNQIADECLIFVLTDGDDTCQVKMANLIDQQTIDKYVKYYKVLLVQLAVDSSISSNNLTAITSYLGGQSVRLGRSSNVSDMRNKMRRALKTSGFSSRLPLEHCYEEQFGPEQSWAELKAMGIDFYQALLLYNKDLLSWEPTKNKQVTALEFAELKFLYGLCFKTGLPDSYVITMLAQLKRPYYYSYDCIYWDFSVARWKYFIPQNKLEQMENPDAQYEDQVGISNRLEYVKKEPENYYEYEIYKVELNNTKRTSFSLREADLGERVINLKPGDLVKFNIG